MIVCPICKAPIEEEECYGSFVYCEFCKDSFDLERYEKEEYEFDDND